MSKPKLLVIGRTATGKDTLAAEMAKLGLSFVKSYTTRPKRSEDEDTHIFVSDSEADVLWDEAAATTVINELRYFATKAQVEENDAYIIDPRGMYELLENMPGTDFAIVYLRADKSESRKRALGRVSDERREDEAKVFDSRYASEDAQFCEFEGKIEQGPDAFPANIVAVHVYENDFTPGVLSDAAADIVARR